MGRPPTRPKKLMNGFYLEVRNRGDKQGIRIRRETREAMEQAIKEYDKIKVVIILGEYRDGSWLEKPIVSE
ncbi:MAG: hypothetical protein JEZ03_10420 [Bacteroidales bacterium]|nr:hypothetical protein [Bacteroidales bacterium]